MILSSIPHDKRSPLSHITSFALAMLNIFWLFTGTFLCATVCMLRLKNASAHHLYEFFKAWRFFFLKAVSSPK
jgi:hypothetical protein